MLNIHAYLQVDILFSAMASFPNHFLIHIYRIGLHTLYIIFGPFYPFGLRFNYAGPYLLLLHTFVFCFPAMGYFDLHFNQHRKCTSMLCAVFVLESPMIMVGISASMRGPRWLYIFYGHKQSVIYLYLFIKCLCPFHETSEAMFCIYNFGGASFILPCFACSQNSSAMLPDKLVCFLFRINYLLSARRTTSSAYL